MEAGGGDGRVAGMAWGGNGLRLPERTHFLCAVARPLTACLTSLPHCSTRRRRRRVDELLQSWAGHRVRRRPSPFHRRVREGAALRSGTVPGSIVERLASPIPTAQRCLHILASSCCPWQKLAVSQESRCCNHGRGSLRILKPTPLPFLHGRSWVTCNPAPPPCNLLSCLCPQQTRSSQHHRDACLIAAAPARFPEHPQEPQRPSAPSGHESPTRHLAQLPPLPCAALP